MLQRQNNICKEAERRLWSIPQPPFFILYVAVRRIINCHYKVLSASLKAKTDAGQHSFRFSQSQIKRLEA